MDATVNLIENYIYFYHLDKFCILPLYPETITDDKQATFNTTNALSRSSPVFTYANSGARTIQFSLSLHRDLMNDLNLNNSTFKSNTVSLSNNADYIDTLVNYLQSASVPVYNAYSATIAGVVPPMVAVRFGNSVFIKGVVTSPIGVTYKKPIMDDGKYACIDVSFTISEIEPYDATTVAAQGSFRGISASQVGSYSNRLKA